MLEISMSPDLLTMVAGAVLSLLFSYIPNLNTWYAAKSEEVKKFYMLILLFIVTAGIFALGCFDVLKISDFTCEKNTVFQFIWIYILALIANQSTYKISPQTLAVRQAKSV